MRRSILSCEHAFRHLIFHHAPSVADVTFPRQMRKTALAMHSRPAVAACGRRESYNVHNIKGKEANKFKSMI